MSCLARAQLVELALADAGAAESAHAFELAHAAQCSQCADRLKQVRAQLSRVEKTMTWFDRDHDEGRRRLTRELAAIARAAHPQRNLTRKLMGVMTMPRTWIGSAAAAALVLGAVFWKGAGPTS